MTTTAVSLSSIETDTFPGNNEAILPASVLEFFFGLSLKVRTGFA
jgi:hypothetical protein